MPTLPRDAFGADPHRARQLAEAFGGDPARYDRTRPRYPQSLVDRIVAASPGRDVLDVGIGTGISARAFESAGCRVLGVDPDRRMADYARRRGFDVEVSTFEEWDPAARTFDAVVAGQTWHWVDPVAGAVKAAQVLRSGGRLAVFWNAIELPPHVRDAFAHAFRRAVPDASSPGERSGGLTGYASFFADAAEGIRGTGAFGEPERWEVDWERSYTRGEWLDVMPTAGGFNRLEPAELDALLGHVGAAIDAIGGSFTAKYAAVAVTAARRNLA